MLTVHVNGKEYPILNQRDEQVLVIADKICGAFKQAATETKIESDKLALAEAAKRGDVKTVNRLAERIKRNSKS